HVAELTGDEHDAEQHHGADRERDERRGEGVGGLTQVRIDRSLQRDHATHDRGRQAGHDLRAHFASSQLSPTPRSTFRGGSSSKAPSMRALTSAQASAISSSGPSNSSSSWIVSTSRVRMPPARRSASQRTIAILMMSAAVPWITVLTASRSPSERV